MKRCNLSLREIILFGILGALTFAMKVAMAALPNIEPVSLTLLVYGAVFGLRALYPCFVYVILEILYFGLGTWNICYFYVWPILIVLAAAFRNMQPSLGWGILSGAFGLAFGALCGIVDVFIGGFGYAAAKWVSGIPFDLAHAGGNFVLALILFIPLRCLVDKLYGNLKRK